jgi:hypothetical protein
MKQFLLAAGLFFSAASFAQNSITCDSIFQTSTCAGGNVIISFQTTGSFPWGNVFTAELSDNWGNWNNPVPMGTTMFVLNGNGIIFGTIPASANFGFLYRVRIVSSNPADTSNNSPNTLIVSQVAQLNDIVSDPGDTACPGDTITLYAVNFASSYLWSTGDTTASIDVTQPGVYSVTTTDALTCESTTSDTVYFDPSFCTGIYEEQRDAFFRLYPNPADDELIITTDEAGQTGTLLISDVTGRIVYSEQVSATMHTVNVSALPAGSYVITYTTAAATGSRKLLIE